MKDAETTKHVLRFDTTKRFEQVGNMIYEFTIVTQGAVMDSFFARALTGGVRLLLPS